MTEHKEKPTLDRVLEFIGALVVGVVTAVSLSVFGFFFGCLVVLSSNSLLPGIILMLGIDGLFLFIFYRKLQNNPSVALQGAFTGAVLALIVGILISLSLSGARF